MKPEISINGALLTKLINITYKLLHVYKHSDADNDQVQSDTFGGKFAALHIHRSYKLCSTKLESLKNGYNFDARIFRAILQQLKKN